MTPMLFPTQVLSWLPHKLDGVVQMPSKTDAKNLPICVEIGRVYNTLTRSLEAKKGTER